MSIQERITKIFVEHLGVEASKVISEATFDDLGADSLDRAELVMNMEEEFNIEIPDVDGANITTIKEAVDYVEGRLA